MILVIVIVTYLFTGCAAKTNYITKYNGKIKIGVCIYDYNDAFMSYMIKEMKDYSQSLNNVEIEYADSQRDSNRELEQAENFISKGVDVLVVNPVDTDSTDPISDKANAAGVPIISVNNKFNNENDPVCFIDSNKKQSAILEMEYLAKKVNYKGNVAIIMGIMGQDGQRLRTQGFHEVIAKYPDMKIVAEQAADWNRSKGRALMEIWLQSAKDINVVACENDELAIGALTAIEKAGKLGKINVGGINASPDALDYLQSGKLAVTVFPNLIGQSHAVLDNAVKAAKGEKVEKTIIFEDELVTPKDADKYIAKWKN
ncbi:MAG: substrate-binding domain-containing protein [Clostridium sp.]|nr:substrate-binding domain-containing protein [Clostridium sp.]